MVHITPSMFAGHDISCPYKGKGANREIGVPRLMRGARPGKPERQTAAASRRTPHEAPGKARRMVRMELGIFERTSGTAE